MDIHLANANG